MKFCTIFAPAALSIAYSQMRASAYRILMWALANLEFDSWQPMSQPHIAGVLNMAQSTVSGAINELIEYDLIERDTQRGALVYRLSAELGWRGTVESWFSHITATRRPAEPADPDNIALLEEALERAVKERDRLQKRRGISHDEGDNDTSG